MSGNEEVKGYYAPIHQSLTKPLLMMGVPRDLFLLNGTFAASFMMMKLYPLMLLNVGIHIVLKSLTKQDEQFFDAIKRHINDKDYYEVR